MVCKYAMRTRSPVQFDRIPAHNWHGCNATPNCQFTQKCVRQKQCPECEPRAHNLKRAYGASNGCRNARHVFKMRAWASFSTLYNAFLRFCHAHPNVYVLKTALNPTLAPIATTLLKREFRVQSASHMTNANLEPNLKPLNCSPSKLPFSTVSGGGETGTGPVRTVPHRYEGSRVTRVSRVRRAHFTMPT